MKVMATDDIQSLARQLADGRISLEDFLAEVSAASTADLDNVQLDLDRRRRCGFAEVIFAEGKTVETLRRVFRRFCEENFDSLATRMAPEKAERLMNDFPTAIYNPVARTFRVPISSRPLDKESRQGNVAVITAGTSDEMVAEEARETALWMGTDVRMIRDVGVAGPQRFQARLPEIRGCDAIVVVAGMEGALPSVVGGHVDCPVIAVPTSVGYGASFGGVAALLGMLNSCAANVTVVNIDAGFKAGYVAGLIATRAARGRQALSKTSENDKVTR